MVQLSCFISSLPEKNWTSPVHRDRGDTGTHDEADMAVKVETRLHADVMLCVRFHCALLSHLPFSRLPQSYSRKACDWKTKFYIFEAAVVESQLMWKKVGGITAEVYPELDFLRNNSVLYLHKYCINTNSVDIVFIWNFRHKFKKHQKQKKKILQRRINLLPKLFIFQFLVIVV